MPQSQLVSRPRFCSECGTPLLRDALFCHNCGTPVGGAGYTPYTAGVSPVLRWGLPIGAFVALVALTLYRASSSVPAQGSEGIASPTAGAIAPPDIAAMSPEERANRLFNRVMQYSSEGKSDSAAFFAPMALQSIEALTPLTLHSRYDIGLVALAAGNTALAAAQSDTILNTSPTHLLGLALAARVADARGDAVAAKAARRKLLGAEKAERAKGLPEYADHDADLRAAIDLAHKD